MMCDGFTKTAISFFLSILFFSLRLKESPALAVKSLHKFDQALYEAENLEADPGSGRVSGNEAALWQVNSFTPPILELCTLLH